MSTNSTSGSPDPNSVKATRLLVQRMAHLSRLSLQTHEIESFSDQMGSILNYIEQLKALDVSDVEPLLSPASLMRDQAQSLREDQPSRPDAESTSRLLACAPEAHGESFGVPPVL